MTVQIFPSELKELVATFASLPTLTLLGRVNREFQELSEAQIYASICTGASYDVCEALEALIKTPRRLSYLKSLSIEFQFRTSDSDALLVDLTLHTVKSAQSLTYLRLHRIGRSDRSRFAKDVNSALLTDTLQLKTLICDEDLDLMGIVKAHPSLRLLATFVRTEIETTAALIPMLHANSHPLTIVGLERDTHLPFFNTIHLFPDSLTQVSPSQFTETLRAAFSPDRSHCQVSLRAESVSTVLLYMDLRPPKETLLRCCESIAGLFPEATEVSLHFHSIDDLLVDETTESLTLFPKLQRVELREWSGSEKPESPRSKASPFPVQRLSGYVNDWKKKFQGLSYVTTSGSYYASPDTDWKVKNRRHKV